MVQSISLDDIKTAITGIRNQKKAWLQYDKSVFQEETRNQPYRGWYYQQDRFFTWQEYSINHSNSFYFTENVVDTTEIAEDIAESVDENFEDRDIIGVNGEYDSSPITSYLTADSNSPESGNI